MFTPPGHHSAAPRCSASLRQDPLHVQTKDDAPFRGTAAHRSIRPNGTSGTPEWHSRVALSAYLHRYRWHCTLGVSPPLRTAARAAPHFCMLLHLVRRSAGVRHGSKAYMLRTSAHLLILIPLLPKRSTACRSHSSSCVEKRTCSRGAGNACNVCNVTPAGGAQLTNVTHEMSVAHAMHVTHVTCMTSVSHVTHVTHVAYEAYVTYVT